MALKQTKEKIQAVQKTHKVTHAMEAVSAVKMRKSQERALEARPYAHHAYAILKRVLESNIELNHPLMNTHTSGKMLLVVVTSDKGLAGSLNTAVLKEVDAIVSNTDIEIEMIAIGKKAVEYAGRKGISVVQSIENISDNVSVSDMRALSDLVARLYTEKSIKECKMVYTHFISTLRSDVQHREILPVNVPALEKSVKWATPKEGKYAEVGEEKSGNGVQEYIFEPNAEAVLDALVPHLLNIELYHALLEAKASEHSARMIAMKNATDRAEEVGKELEITYNKQRQAAITGELIDIVGGAAASS